MSSEEKWTSKSRLPVVEQEGLVLGLDILQAFIAEGKFFFGHTILIHSHKRADSLEIILEEFLD